MDRSPDLHDLCQRTFNTGAGQDLLDELELQFCRSVFSRETNQMAYNCGQSDLVQLLRTLTSEPIEDTT